MYSLMKQFLLLSIAVLTISATAAAQHTHHHHDRVIDFPDLPGYLTLKTDLHIHTVFSDGSVWPNIRVQEAVRDGLDAIAVTDHIEYQPHKDDIPHPDRNRSFDIASDAANGTDLIVIRGSEITRSMPPGHSNAIFLEDVNPMLQDDPVPSFEEARRQGAFVFWNHPAWERQVPTGVAALTDMHRGLIDDGLLHGIEVVNMDTYSDEALQIALDHDLTIMGTSDIHGLVDWQFDVPHGHRPVTLVFAPERTADAVHEALLARRTAVWFKNMLIGRDEWVVPLVEASLSVAEASYRGSSLVLDVTLENSSDAAFILQNRGDFTFHAHGDLVEVAPKGRTRLEIKTLERKQSVQVPFEVLNAVTAPGQHPVFTLEIPVE